MTNSADDSLKDDEQDIKLFQSLDQKTLQSEEKKNLVNLEDSPHSSSQNDMESKVCLPKIEESAASVGDVGSKPPDHFSREDENIYNRRSSLHDQQIPAPATCFQPGVRRNSSVRTPTLHSTSPQGTNLPYQVPVIQVSYASFIKKY